MKFTDDQLDALTEVINIGAGRAAAALSNITDSRIRLDVPQISTFGVADFREQFVESQSQSGTVIRQGFTGDVSGRAFLAFSTEAAIKLAHLVQGEADRDETLNPADEGVLEEIGNILLNGILGSIANVLNTGLQYTVPNIEVSTTIFRMLSGDSTADKDGLTILIAEVTFDVDNYNIEGSLYLAFEVGHLDRLLSELLSPNLS